MAYFLQNRHIMMKTSGTDFENKDPGIYKFTNTYNSETGNVDTTYTWICSWKEAGITTVDLETDYTISAFRTKVGKKLENISTDFCAYIFPKDLKRLGNYVLQGVYWYTKYYFLEGFEAFGIGSFNGGTIYSVHLPSTFKTYNEKGIIFSEYLPFYDSYLYPNYWENKAPFAGVEPRLYGYPDGGFHVSEDNKIFSSDEDGNLLSADGMTLYLGCSLDAVLNNKFTSIYECSGQVAEKKYMIGVDGYPNKNTFSSDKVTYICERAFQNCYFCKSSTDSTLTVTLPNLRDLNTGTFIDNRYNFIIQDCTKLTAIADNVFSIDDYYNDTNTYTITIKNCPNLKSVGTQGSNFKIVYE
jgi:hypothetical protein